MDINRNTIEGFAKLVRKNSDYISREFEAGNDVHVVTQHVISLLGLIIFPYEALRQAQMFPPYQMKALYEQRGWPRFELVRGHEFERLEDLIKHLRDAISHYQIKFEPADERRLADITITFGWPNARDDRSRLTKINGAALRDFVDRFSKCIENQVS